MKIALLCAFLVGLAFQSFSQSRQVSGTILSRSGGTPVAGATVTVKGTTIATTSNEQGNFTIQVPQANNTLVVSHTSMAALEVPITGSTLSISLSEQENILTEVVVIGYGTQRRSEVTSAISTIRSDEFATVSSTRIEQVLQGRTAGVTVHPNSGSPGSGLRIRIRGTGSNAGAEPLYIVDGVRTGGIDNLDPSEIASFDILKDAASAAIYGSSAANGVVLITTKTGRRNGSEISYSFQHGRQSVGDLPKMMNAAQYQQYLMEAGTPGAPTPADLAALQGRSTDWLDALFQKAPLTRHSLSLSGGSDRSTYLFNGTYFTQEGIIGGPKSKFDRYTFRINTDQKVRSWLNLGQRFSYANIQRKGINENNEFGSVVSSALVLDPFTPVTFSGALSTRAQNALTAGKTLVRDENGAYYGISDYIFGEYGNPLARIATTNGNLLQHKIEGNVFADIQPFTGLTLTSRFGIDGAFQREHYWTPTFWFSNESQNTLAGGSDFQNNWYNWQWENFATWRKGLGDHNFSVMAGTSANRFYYNNLGGTYSGLFKENDLFSYADAVPDTYDKITSTNNRTALLSFFGRGTYNFQDKYLFNASLRRDGASVFAEGHKWGTFPAVSAGWLISNESFFAPMANNLSYLKLRASWGRNGSTSNTDIGAWQALIGTVTPGYLDANGNYQVGAAPTNLPNPELTWETSEQVDVGTDVAFMNNRIELTVDYFKKTTIDLLTPGGGIVPGFVGNNLTVTNSGNVVNKGWEFDLTFRNSPAMSAGFQYEISGNLTTLKNNVEELNEFVNELGGAGVGTGWNATFFRPGFPVWSFRGYKTDGIFQNQQEINAYMAKTGITGYNPKPGDPIVVDVDGDKTISTADQTFIGSPHPDLVYGARMAVGFKGFDFLVFMQGQSGNEVVMGFNRTDRPTANKPEFFYTNRWTGEGSTNTWFASNTNNPYIYNSDLMVFDGSYTRIKQLQLGYTLPASILQKVRMKGARVYVSLDDYFTFTRYPGLDPEGGSGGNNSIGIDRGVYPLARKALVGVSVNF